MKRKRIYAFLAALSLLCSGCKSSGSEKNAENTLDYVYDNLMGVTYMENGMLYYDDDYLLNYFDIKSSLSTVICSDPSCKHPRPSPDKPSDCSAVIYNMGLNSLAYMGDKLYLSYEEDDTTFTHKSFFTADKDGSNRKRFAKIEAENIQQTLYTNDRIIVSFQNTIDWSDENAVALDQLEEWTAGIYIISISDGKATKICAHTGKEARIESLSFDGENIFYLFTYYEDTVYNAALYKYNIESGENGTIKSFKEIWGVDDNKCFGSTGMLYVDRDDSTAKTAKLHVLSFDGTDTVIAEEGANIGRPFYLDDSKICYIDCEAGDDFHYCIYDMESGETFKNEKDWRSTFVEAVFDDVIYVLYPPDINDNNLDTGYISKEDFINGDYDKVVPIK